MAGQGRQFGRRQVVLGSADNDEVGVCGHLLRPQQGQGTDLVVFGFQDLTDHPVAVAFLAVARIVLAVANQEIDDLLSL